MIPRFIFGRALVLIAAALSLLWPILPGYAGEPEPSAPQVAPAKPPSGAIPLSEIASQAAEVNNSLHALKAHLAPNPVIQKITTQLPDLRDDIEQAAEETSELLRAGPTLEKLQAEQKLWQARLLLVSDWLKTLTARANELKKALDQVDEKRRTWIATREAAQTSYAPAQILQQIDDVITSLDEARTTLEMQNRDGLGLQSTVAREVSRCESMFSQVAQAQQKEVGGLFTRDVPAIWSGGLRGDADRLLWGSVERAITASLGEIRRYVRNSTRGLLLHVGLFIAVALLLGAAGRKAHRRNTAGGRELSGLEVFDCPWSAAYLVSIVYVTGPFSSSPETVKSLLKAAAFLPVIRLMAPLGSWVVSGACVAGLLFALEVVRQTFDITPLLEQSFLVIVMVTGIAVLGWACARRNLRPFPAQADRAALDRTVAAVSGLLLMGLAMGLVAGILGYLRLARLSASAVLPFGFLVLLLYSCLRVLMGLVTFSLTAWPLARLRLVQHHRDLLMRRAHRWLIWLIVFIGVLRSLDHLGLYQPGLGFLETILSTKLERGAFSLTPGDVLAFCLTVWAAYLLSTFVRFLLHEDVYPRMGIPVGLSYAASSLLHYVILALGVVVGMAVLGVDLTRVTVLAGALGVGIGFGLQGVVNNFVSGLILLFERPIHVGDSIEVGEDLGEVRRIGIRASTIRTRQGAEIIIPNAQLVTEKVTNWTLSDQNRRIDIAVGVNYGAVPREVIEVLEKVAHAHSRVLEHPPPQGLLVGFGDSSVNFELRAWTDEYADWTRVRSDLTIGIYDAVRDSGWSFPFPQQEIRVLNLRKANAVSDKASPLPEILE